MQRIILHWTGGGHRPGTADLRHYHSVIDGSGRDHPGHSDVEVNRPPLRPGGYAAHRLNANSGATGLALAAMAGARERLFDRGAAPVLPLQLAALAGLCADLLRRYRIPLRRETVLTHAEVQPLPGIAQRGKWDITWLPGMERPGDALAVGDRLRDMVRQASLLADGRQAPSAGASGLWHPGWEAVK